MNESQISVRYAKALFQSASEKQLLERVFKDMELLSNICKLDDFLYMLVLPSMQTSQKHKMADSIFAAHISEISLSMINLVIRNKREAYLPGIARNYADMYRKAMGIRTAKLLTAQPVDDSAMNGIKELIRKTYNSDVALSSSVDKDIIGGFVLTIENQQYNASVANSLKRLKKKLLQTSIENK